MASQHAVDTLPDRRGLRSVLGSFATGVTVVTTESRGELHGMTANAFTSVSLDPPLVLVCFTTGSRTATAVAERGEFVVNILAEGQIPVSQRFARAGEDHFAGARMRLDDHGLPVLLDNLGHLACVVSDTHQGGDHDIVVASVRHARTRPGSPLVFFGGAYRRLAEDTIVPETCWYS